MGLLRAGRVAQHILCTTAAITAASVFGQMGFETTYIDKYSHQYPGAPPKSVLSKPDYINVAPSMIASVPTPVTYITSTRGSVPLTAPGQWLTCSEVLSGNSLKLSQGDMVTLLGVDLPRQAIFGEPENSLLQQTFDFTSATVTGKQIRLEYESGVRDQYGRLLAYVILPNGQCVNEMIISRGYGLAHRQFPYKLQKRYLHLEQLAKHQQSGLWAGDL